MDNMLRQSVQVLRPSYGQDASFGITPTAISGYASALSGNIAAAVCPASPSVQMNYAMRQIVVTHNIYFQQNAISGGIKNGDVLYDGTTYYRVNGYTVPASDGRIYKVDAAQVLP